jgi:hypothetical protein
MLLNEFLSLICILSLFLAAIFIFQIIDKSNIVNSVYAPRLPAGSDISECCRAPVHRVPPLNELTILVNDIKDNLNKQRVPEIFSKHLGFESPTGSIANGFGWGSSEHIPASAGTPDRLERVTTPVIEGNFALKATVLKGDFHMPTNGARAEVETVPPYFREGETVVYQWHTLFPIGFPTPTHSEWEVWTQWHQPGTGQATCLNNMVCFPVPVALTLHSDKISLEVINKANQNFEDTLWTDNRPLKLGDFYNITLLVKWSKTNAGYIGLWIDGENKLPITHHITLDNDNVNTADREDTVYMKQGLYRDRTINLDQSINHDGMMYHGLRWHNHVE